MKLTVHRQLWFSIDEHELSVVAIDFEPVRPYTTTGVMLDVGQRMDVLVVGTGKSTGAYHIRTRNMRAQGCKVDKLYAPSKSALAVIYYEGASPSDPAIPPFINSKPWPLGEHCNDDPLEFTTPYRVEPAAVDGVHTFNLEMTVGLNDSGIILMYMNGTSLRTNFSDPVLRDAARGEEVFPDMYNLFDTGNAKVVRFVIVNNMPAAHGMHMHGGSLIFNRQVCPPNRRSLTYHLQGTHFRFFLTRQASHGMGKSRTHQIRFDETRQLSASFPQLCCR